MRRLTELFVLVTIWIGAAMAINHWCARPWQCNLALHRATTVSMAFGGAAAGAPEVPILARENIEELSPCLANCPADVPLAMILAYNYRKVGNPQRAVEIYQRAFLYDRRPELYLNLGLAMLEGGHESEGLRTLIQAALYNPEFVDEISVHHDDVKRAVDSYQIHLQELKKQH